MKLFYSLAFAAIYSTSLMANTPSEESNTNLGDPAANSGALNVVDENYVTTIEDFKQAFPSVLGEGEIGKLGNNAEIRVGENQVYLNGVDTNKLIMSYGNLEGQYQGAISALDESYTIIFQFSDIGYVKDDETIEADDLMQQMQDNDLEVNKMRAQAGVGSLHTIGWSQSPTYNVETNNLEYGVKFRDDTGYVTVNHTVKLLGRKGVTEAVLICDTDALESLRPVLAKAIAEFSYVDGHKYSEFSSGDKIAEYGLNGLIAGGAIVALAKFGPKVWKLIIAGVIALGVGLLKVKSIFSRSKKA